MRSYLTEVSISYNVLQRFAILSYYIIILCFLTWKRWNAELIIYNFEIFDNFFWHPCGTHHSTGNMMSLCQGKDFIFTKIVFFQHWFNKMTLLAIFSCNTIFVCTIIYYILFYIYKSFTTKSVNWKNRSLDLNFWKNLCRDVRNTWLDDKLPLAVLWL